MLSYVRRTFKCRNTPQGGPYRPENAALLSDVLWPVDGPVRLNMPTVNPPLIVRLGNVIVTGALKMSTCVAQN